MRNQWRIFWLCQHLVDGTKSARQFSERFPRWPFSKILPQASSLLLFLRIELNMRTAEPAMGLKWERGHLSAHGLVRQLLAVELQPMLLQNMALFLPVEKFVYPPCHTKSRRHRVKFLCFGRKNWRWQDWRKQPVRPDCPFQSMWEIHWARLQKVHMRKTVRVAVAHINCTMGCYSKRTQRDDELLVVGNGAWS